MAPKVSSWTSIPFVFLRVSCSTSVPSASLPNDWRLKPGRLDDGLFWLDQAPAIVWARTTPAISINVDDNPGICIAGEAYQNRVTGPRIGADHPRVRFFGSRQTHADGRGAVSRSRVADS